MIYTDISYYQNQPKEAVYLPIDWAQMVTQGATGTYIKASQGLWPDRQFIRNWVDSAGTIDRGPYHFFEPDKDPIKQAEFFHGMITKAQSEAHMTYFELAPMLDLEWLEKFGLARKPNPLTYLDKVTDFIGALMDYGYERPVIYSNYSHILTFLPMPSKATAPARYDKWAALGLYRLWIAQYHAQKVITLAGPNVPRPWVDWAIWQCSADGNGLGRAYGVHSPSIDLSRVNIY
jgi:GH25 family lysozyme M1 (1,4-beta-N-acetylmuramidase)